MKWRDVIIGALVSITASVIAGVLVWVFTREAKIAEVEQLHYRVDEVASFSPGPGKIGIVTIKVSNVGNKAARDVRSVFVLPEGVEIREKQIAMSSGPAGVFVESSESPRKLNLTMPTLAPTETVTTSLLVQGLGKFTPEVGLRSDDTVGTEGDTQLVSASAPKRTARITEAISVAIGVMPLVFFVFGWIQLRGSVPTLFPSVNNTAFLYLQQKKVEDAKIMLSDKARTKGADVFETANLALAFGLSGSLEEAERLFKIAEWWASSRHHKAVTAYDRAVLYVASGDYENGKKKLREAVSLSPRAISGYFKLNEYFAEASTRDPEFKTIMS
jgi:hypothetical protein